MFSLTMKRAAVEAMKAQKYPMISRISGYSNFSPFILIFTDFSLTRDMIRKDRKIPKTEMKYTFSDRPTSVVWRTFVDSLGASFFLFEAWGSIYIFVLFDF